MPVRHVAQIGDQHPNSQSVDKRQAGKAEYGDGGIQRVEAALVIHDRDRPRKAQLVAPAEFVNQSQDMAVRGKPMMVIALNRPIPVRLFEAGGQSPHIVQRFEHGYLPTGARQVVGRRQAACAGTDNCHPVERMRIPGGTQRTSTSDRTFRQLTLSRAM